MRRAIAAALALSACGPPDWDGLLGSQGPGLAEQCGLVRGRLALHAVLVSGGESCAAGWTTYWELDETARIIVPERMQGCCCPAAAAVSGCAVSLTLECPGESWRFAISLDSREGAVVTTTPEETCRYEARLARPPEP